MRHLSAPAVLFSLLSTAVACSEGGPSNEPSHDARDDGSDRDTGELPPDADSDTVTDAGEADSEVDTDTSATPPIALGDEYRLTIDAAAPSLRLSRRDELLATFGPESITIGVLETLRDSDNYDPYGFLWDEDPFIHKDGPVDAWLDWRSVVVTGEADGEAVRLRVEFADGQTATMDVSADADGRFSIFLRPQTSARNVAYFRLRPQVDATEAYYGLGEQFDSVNQRGKVRAMQLELQSDLESRYNEAHVPIPLLIGTRGWGLFVESYSPSVFDVGAHDPERIDVIVGTGPDSVEGLRAHLLVADHPLDVTRHYYEITGYPAIPSPWALGPWVWRDENDDQAQVESDATTIRALDLATSAYWIDRPYATGVNTFDFDEGRFPDPEGMIEHLHALGFRVAVWHTPYLDETDASTEALREVAEGSGFYPPVHGLLLNGWGRPIDLSNPEAFAWWQTQIARYVELGIEGFKLDYGEDVVPGALGARNRWEFADGTSERTMHKRFPLLYHRAYAELLPAEGGFLLCRAATWGDQTQASVIWPGDLDADLVAHGERVTDRNGEEYVAVGGLEASLIAALSLGPSGFPLFGSDTGGYRHSPPDRETFTRWFEVTAFSSVMQVGTSSSDVAWEFNDLNGFDDEMLGWYRDYTRLHLRLWPYLWTYLLRVQDDGRPIQRALGLAYPELGAHPDDAYLLGDNLYVAPVVRRGVTRREVVFPPDDDWVDWWTGELYAAGSVAQVDAPLHVIPAYLRAGSVVPMLRPTIDTLSPTTRPDEVDSFVTDPGTLHVVLARGDGEPFSLYDGTTIDVGQDGAVTTIAHAGGTVFATGAIYEMIGESAQPETVRINGEVVAAAASFDEVSTSQSAWFHDGQRGGTLWIAAPADAQISVTR